MNIKEEWKSVVGFPDYEVSNYGRIKSLIRFKERTCPHTNRKYLGKYGGKILEQGIGWSKRNPNNRYPMFLFVTLCMNNKKYSKTIHRMVLEAFIGPCPSNMEGCHNDGSPLNNRLENLRWDTKRNNHLDRNKHGTMGGFKKGENHPSKGYICGSQMNHSKLNEKLVKYIREQEYYKGLYVALSNKFGISKSTITDVISRRTWKHI